MALRGRLTAMGLIAILALAACGKSGDKDEATVTTNPGAGAAAFSGDPSSPYCKEAAAWAAHEVTPADEGDPAAYRVYWGEYVRFLNKAHPVAPAEIKGDWDTYSQFMLGRFTPVLQKYGYDGNVAHEQGTAEERALFEGTDEPTGKAFDRIITYESEVCGTGQPQPADTRFTGSQDSAYCRAQKDNVEAFRQVMNAGADPAQLRAYFTGSGFTSYLDQLERSAPDAIAADVRANVAFTRSHFLPALEKYGYDFRKALTTGTSEDRHAVDFATPAERGPSSRQAAYDMAVCQL